MIGKDKSISEEIVQKWTVSVGVMLSIEYDDIEAETEEEAKFIAKQRAEEDVDFNNATLDRLTVYCAYSDDDYQWGDNL